MSHPMLSVVIPLYNKGREISRAIHSVLDQTFADFELVVVDDGSTDASVDEVKAFEDARIRLVHRKHVNSGGGHAARNRGIAEARAEMVAFLDADDEWKPEYLETVLSLVQRYPGCGAYATAYEIVSEMDQPRLVRLDSIPATPWEGIIPNYFRSAPGYPVWTSAVAIPRRVFEVVGGFPEGVPRGGDLDMWCRIALKYLIAFSSRPLAVWHLEADNRTPRRHPVPHHSEYCLIKTINNALSRGAVPPWTTAGDLVEYRNSKLLEIASINLEGGDLNSAQEHLRMAAPTRRFRLPRLRALARTYRYLSSHYAAQSRFTDALEAAMRGLLLDVRLASRSGLRRSFELLVHTISSQVRAILGIRSKRGARRTSA
jgi:glycosyltransferase involved in cell wall biosynthesis